MFKILLKIFKKKNKTFFGEPEGTHITLTKEEFPIQEAHPLPLSAGKGGRKVKEENIHQTNHPDNEMMCHSHITGANHRDSE